jgi:hypothetical protein
MGHVGRRPNFAGAFKHSPVVGPARRAQSSRRGEGSAGRADPLTASPAGIAASDNDQLNRVDALPEISRHTQSRGRDFNLDVGITPQQAVEAPVEPVPAALEKRLTPDAQREHGSLPHSSLLHGATHDVAVAGPVIDDHRDEAGPQRRRFLIAPNNRHGTVRFLGKNRRGRPEHHVGHPTDPHRSGADEAGAARLGDQCKIDIAVQRRCRS